MSAEPVAIESLTPNALLIVASIGALTAWGGSSPKSDDVGTALGANAAWVRRHGKGLDHGLATLSVNGHCHLGERGRMLAARLREAVPEAPSYGTCPWCRSPRVGEFLDRALYACGRVMQWCPDRVPGLPRAVIPKRAERAQHRGVWFRAARCGEHHQGGRWQGHPSTDGPILSSWSCDGVELVPGTPVSANFGSGRYATHGGLIGVVRASANGTVIVDWPAVEVGATLHEEKACPVGEARAESLADIVPAKFLITPGAPDETGLSDYQRRLYRALRDGTVVLRAVDGAYEGRFENRPVVPRALGILIEHRLLAPPPSAA